MQMDLYNFYSPFVSLPAMTLPRHEAVWGLPLTGDSGIWLGLGLDSGSDLTRETDLLQPERETISHNRLLEALTFKATRIAFCLRFFIAAIRSIKTFKFYHNFSPQNNGAHVKVI